MPIVLEEVQHRLDKGHSPREITKELELKKKILL